ncbi:MAG: hypothetical protein ACLFP8_04415 [Alphaproteobacteria bacterium]
MTRIIRTHTLPKTFFPIKGISAYIALWSFLLCLLPSFACAVEELNYKPTTATIGASLKLQLDYLLKEKFNTESSDYLIADTDLNADNQPEYILKNKNCGQQAEQCPHLIIADMDNDLALLSEIKAKHLMIGNGKNYGISNILAFKNHINAYDFDIYMWSPQQKMYILEESKKRD